VPIAVAILGVLAAGPTPAHAAPGEEVAVVRTPHGEITWRFFEADAPGHVAYVKELIRKGFYDGSTLHRVIPHFVIQGGDPNSKNADRSDDGDGEADRRLKAEFSQRLHYRPGTVGMARDADPDSGSCQFFIALADIPRLDGRYTIFGEVVSGLEVAQRIAALPRDLNDNPLERAPVTVRLETRRVKKPILSLAAAVESGEVLTGPLKARPYDPGNLLWRAPRLKPGGADPAGGSPAPAAGRSSGGTAGAAGPARLELTVAADGTVLDVRFPGSPEPQAAARLRGRALGWRFEPAVYDGRPQKVRLEIDADGRGLGPPTGGGAPLELSSEFSPPRPAPRVVLEAGQAPPPKPARLRLTIDETGRVMDAALQSSCGDPALDEAAVRAALALAFSPALRLPPGGREPRAVAVYLDAEARFVAPEEVRP
jgi:peptidyl-prolyl cis-trans isomerase B (cyclophilin B)